MYLLVNHHKVGLTKTAPTNQAGHQMHHTTTCVHRPDTRHPNAAWASTSLAPTPARWHPALKTTGGDRACKTKFTSKFLKLQFVLVEGRGLLLLVVSSRSVGEAVPKKERGKERMPMRKPREKLRVERVARNMPRRRREKHLMSWRCWRVVGR